MYHAIEIKESGIYTAESDRRFVEWEGQNQLEIERERFSSSFGEFSSILAVAAWFSAIT